MPTMGQTLLLGKRAVPEIKNTSSEASWSLYSAMGPHIQCIQVPIAALLCLFLYMSQDNILLLNPRKALFSAFLCEIWNYSIAISVFT